MCTLFCRATRERLDAGESTIVDSVNSSYGASGAGSVIGRGGSEIALTSARRSAAARAKETARRSLPASSAFSAARWIQRTDSNA
jgi:hypothetical protein